MNGIINENISRNNDKMRTDNRSEIATKHRLKPRADWQ